ncbi:nitric oxide reductase activation protein NorD [Sulfuriflexus sp.]|uniref:nitric oxide reductase activation protein NorD n=1 Tax=Sulfuriflexus sp. TaxID=2015443 RepID=UPI0028CF28AB|nr:VWA domain-containing protein [Sulfuriflexus sp.]MDT8403097.1 VWA domain-containing protein [Sulfuriflexus sp.]
MSLAGPDKKISTEISAEMQAFREQLKCGFKDLDDIFVDCMSGALAVLSTNGIKAYLEGASLICMIGRGFEPVLVYLEEMPGIAQRLGEATLSMVSKTVWDMSRTPNGKAIPPFLNTLAEAARRLGSEEQLQHYVEILQDMMERTTGSVHGFHTSIPSPGLPDLLNQMPYLLSELSLEGIRNWIDYGISNYSSNPERQKDYFCLQSADSKAILSRERHGTLFIDHERKLDLYLQALWAQKSSLLPYSNAFDQLRKPIPYYDKLGIRVPDVFDDKDGVTGIDRYRAVLAHIASHQRWTTAIVADNFSPFQRIAIETLEDSRVEYLAMRDYPGLRKILLSLHPAPAEDACDPTEESCIRHRLAMLSYGILNPQHGYKNSDLLDCIAAFNDLMQQVETQTKDIVQLAISYIARTRLQSDQSPRMHFKDTEIDYRDDNRHMWVFIEEGDEEEAFEDNRDAAPKESEFDGLPPRHYKEWNYKTMTYRPDWVSLYETLHPSGNAADIDKVLDKHAGLAKQLRHILDMLKPQQYVRVRYQEEGSELDLDVAIRSLIDFKSGAQPDPRINMSHKHDGRDIAVMLLLDLSASLADTPEGCTQTILQLSQEAVALLGWSIEHLGDKFAIAGFSSNTRHEVRYQHIKGYSEHWNTDVKARLAAMTAGYSTRMGAAMRHASHYLGAQKADKKLLLVLTDGEPSDIDVDDPQLLIKDAHKAVQELDQEGIYTYCINLDANVKPGEDDYVTGIFGNHYTIIDKIERLPEKLPKLFMALTG